MSFACRIGGPDRGEGEGADEFGQLQGVRPTWGGEETHGDILNWGMWQLAKAPTDGKTTDKSAATTDRTGERGRTIPGWAQVWAAKSAHASRPSSTDDRPFNIQINEDGTGGIVLYQINQGGPSVAMGDGNQANVNPVTGEFIPLDFGDAPPGFKIDSIYHTVEKVQNALRAVNAGPHGVDVQPVLNRGWDIDQRFAVKALGLPPGVRGVPAKIGGVVVTGTEEYEQHDLFVPAMPNVLVAPHHDGHADIGSLVYDLTDKDELDKVRNAHLQTLTRVWQIGPNKTLQNLCGRYGFHALAIQAGPARGSVNSRAAFADVGDGTASPPAEVIGLGSWQAGGPFHPGSSSDKHSYGGNEDGDSITSLHIPTQAYFYQDRERDAPIDFSPLPWEKPKSAGDWWLTEIRYDAESKHGHPTGQKSGLWRAETRFPMFYPPPPPELTSPALDHDKDRQTQPFKDQTFTDPVDDDTTDPTDDDATDPADDSTSDPTWDTDPVVDKTLSDPVIDSTDDGGKKDPTEDIGKVTDPFTDSGISNPYKENSYNPFGGNFPATDPAHLDETNGANTFNSNPDVDNGVPPGAIQIGGPGKLTGSEPKVQGGIFQEGTTRSMIGGAPTALPTLRSLNKISSPGLLVYAQQRSIIGDDYQHSVGWDSSDIKFAAKTQPAVLNIEGLGAETVDGSFVYHQGPGTAIYGQTAAGGIAILPPNTRLTDYWDGNVPSTQPQTDVTLAGVGLGFGDPTRSGAPGDGYRIRLDPVSGELVVDSTDASGTVTSTGTLWPTVAGDIQSGLDTISTTQGSIIYYNGTDWVELTPGTAGQALVTGGAGADPVWDTVSGSGLTVGDLASRPATPAAVGETYIINDKIDPNGSTGNADATEAINIGVEDALTWAKLGIINGFPQTVSSNWTFSGSPRVSGDLTKTGGGTIDANKLVTKTVGTSFLTDRALTYNGTSFDTRQLKLEGGGTNSDASAFPNARGFVYVNAAANALVGSASPDAKGGQVAVSNLTTLTPEWSWDLFGGKATGTDTAGADRTISGMQSTGNADGGAVNLSVSIAGASGTSSNSLVNVVKVDGRSNVVLNARGSALATGATAGFVYMPSCAGTPTGVPASSYTGGVPLVVDSTNTRIYGRIAGAWVNLSGGGGGADLATTLGLGNTTGANDIVQTNGQYLAGEDTSGGSPAGALNLRGGFCIDASAAGGDVIVTGGAGLTAGNVLAYGADASGSNVGGGIVSLLGGKPTGTGSSSLTFYVGAGGHTSGSSAGTQPLAFELQGSALNKKSGTDNYAHITGAFEDGGQTSSATVRVLRVAPTINYTAASKTGAYECLVVDPTLTSEPTGTNLLAAFRTGGTNKVTIKPNGETATITVNTTVKASTTGTASIDDTGSVWPCDTTSAGFTITLPTAVGRSGRHYWIKKTSADGNTLMLGTTSSQTIDGTTTKTTTTQYVTWHVVSDGSNWHLL